ncbi:MAG: NAD(P)/FAD-dependent oxidoreductase [Candidatus Omnitrophica bacterium]|nr:NAD(P)/FAD-dependent oxidoreductase [Candidatus Omnitrophota bacterium]
MPKRIIVLGGGAAGMMAAIRAGLLGQKVLLIEKGSSLGRKLCLSGKGRGNLTNIGDINTFLENFNPTGQFLRNAFSHFFNQELMAFFEQAGLTLKTERQGRVFPRSERAQDILRVLEQYLAKVKVEIIYNRSVREILLKGKRVAAVKLDDGRILAATGVILATGGGSFPQTGSSGDGQQIAEKLGHRVIPLRAALVPLLTQEKWVKDLAGLTLKNVRICLLVNDRRKFSQIGELLFTHFGVSGPVVLSLSGDIVDLLRSKEAVEFSIDFKPGLSPELLKRRLERELQGRLILKNLLKSFLPHSLISVFIALTKIRPDKKVNQLTQAERKQLLGLMKDFRLGISGFLPLKQAMVTRGGISAKEIDPRTMQSKLIKGLYFAGEIIDVDGKTGGYNLQAAFSTGYLAGENAAKNQG